jgi:predicted nucleic acid-binding protein
MPDQDFHTPKLSLAYAKIVATPRESSWSQVYNAGSLFVVLSLTITNSQDTILLSSIGKEIFNTLEAEFFSLQEKTLSSIQSSLEKSLESLSPDIESNACLAYLKNKILYLILSGKGKVIMKRDNTLGTLLDKKTPVPTISSSSGFLKQGDTILIQTDRFAQNVSDLHISEAFKLQLPSDIAESLSPHVHKTEDGAQAAIILTYNGGGETPIAAETKTPTPAIQNQSENETIEPEKPYTSPSKPKLKFPQFILTRRQKTLAIISLLLIILLGASIHINKVSQESSKNQALYKQVFSEAEKNYTEGQEMSAINRGLALDNFRKARETLKKNINNFKPGSEEQQNLSSLLKKVEKEFGSEPKNETRTKIVNLEKTALLSIEKDIKALAYAQDSEAVYVLTAESVNAIDKTENEKKEILKNDNDWSDPVAIAPYLSNFYILDKKEGVLKFTPSQEGLVKLEYFKSPKPDISKANSLAIDGSVWILTLDGKVLKFTSGEPDQFTITGLDKPLSSPAKIFTHIDLENIYILDNGNSRIVKLSKSGSFQNQYTSAVIKNAKDFDVLESNKKIHILSEGKIYEMLIN